MQKLLAWFLYCLYMWWIYISRCWIWNFITFWQFQIIILTNFTGIVFQKGFAQLQYGEFKVTVQYANEVLALDLLEIVLIGWHSAQFRMLQYFTSWCEGCTRALQHIVLDMIILSYISFIVSFCILLRWSSIWYMILILEIWLKVGIKIYYILKYN